MYTCKVKHSESSKQRTEQLKTDTTSEAYFLDLFERFQDPIFRFLYFRVQDRNLALDITQDTFSKTWVYLSKGNTIEHEEAFLYRTARNALIDYFKKPKSYSLDLLAEGGFDPESNATVQGILSNDDIKTIQSIIKDLDEESKQIVYFRFSEERPIEEIATLFGKSTNAMTVQIHRIIKKLRGAFTDINQHGT